MSRASTMILALLVLHILLAALCLVVARGEKKSMALRLWGWGLLAYAVGLLVTLLPAIQLDLRKVLGNSIIALSAILTAAGLLEHSAYRLNRKWVGAAYIITVLILVVNHLRPVPSVVADILAPSPLANVLFIFAAVALVRTPSEDAKSAARFLAGILVFSVPLWTARIWLVWVALGGTNDRDRADLTISLFAIGQMLIAVAATLGLFWVEVRKMEASLRRLASTDALTGLLNWRATVERFQEEAARSIRHQRPFSMILFDIDFFKKCNDTYGHGFGDEVLKHVARSLESAKRDVDVLGRLGGEEFVAILTEESLSGAVVAADRLRKAVTPIVAPDGKMVPITLSGGIVSAPEDGLSWDELFLIADRRLYEAKAGGRNQVIGSDPVAHLGRTSSPFGIPGYAS